MTKADVVTEIVQETGLDKNEALKAIEAFMASIKNSLTNGQNVSRMMNGSLSDVTV